MSPFEGSIADIGMDTISLSGTLPMKLRAVKDRKSTRLNSSHG